MRPKRKRLTDAQKFHKRRYRYLRSDRKRNGKRVMDNPTEYDYSERRDLYFMRSHKYGWRRLMNIAKGVNIQRQSYLYITT